MRLPLLLLVGTSLAFAPAPLPRVKKPDLEALQGSWRRVSYTLGGKPVPLVNPGGPPVHLVVEGKAMSFTQGPTTHGVWDFTLSPGEKPPRVRMRWRTMPGQEQRGVYKVEGDKLTICTSSDAKGAAGFDGRPPNTYHSVFRRAPKGAR